MISVTSSRVVVRTEENVASVWIEQIHAIARKATVDWNEARGDLVANTSDVVNPSVCSETPLRNIDFYDHRHHRNDEKSEQQELLSDVLLF